MIDWLIIAEKKDQGTHIAEGVCDLGKPSGSLTNGGFGGNNISSVLNGEVRVVRAQGHLFEMKYPDDQDDKYNRKGQPVIDPDFGIELASGWKSDKDMLKVYPVQLDLNNIKWRSRDSRSKSLAENIKRCYMDAKNIIVATDFDNEGEMIFRNWLLNEVAMGKRKWDQTYRVKLNDLSKPAVKKAFDRSRLIPYSSHNREVAMMKASGFARSIADYEYGMSFSYYGRLFQNRFGGQGQYGRLKNSILGVVYKAECAHDNFVPSSQYRIDLRLPDKTTLRGITEYKDSLAKEFQHLGLGENGLLFKTKAEAQAFINSGKLSNVVNVLRQKRQMATKASKLYSRNELIIDAEKRYKSLYARDETSAKILQSLYDTYALLTYIRTDIRYIFEEDYLELQKLFTNPMIQQLIDEKIEETMMQHQGLPRDIKLNASVKANKRWVDDKKAAEDSHYAIIPTQTDPKSVWNSLTSAQKAVYKLVLGATMAMFANDSITEQYAYQTDNGLFSDTRSKTLQYGWRLLTGDILTDDTISDPYQGAAEYIISEVKAKRPSLFTPTSILTFLKRKNWGTKSTRDKTRDDMLARKTLRMDRGKIRIQKDLRKTIDFLIANQLIDFELTGRWQTILDKLQNDQQALQFVEQNRKYNQQVNQKVKTLMKL